MNKNLDGYEIKPNSTLKFHALGTDQMIGNFCEVHVKMTDCFLGINFV